MDYCGNLFTILSEKSKRHSNVLKIRNMYTDIQIDPITDSAHHSHITKSLNLCKRQFTSLFVSICGLEITPSLIFLPPGSKEKKINVASADKKDNS